MVSTRLRPWWRRESVDENDGLFPPNQCSGCFGGTHTPGPERRDGRTYSLGKDLPWRRHAQIRRLPLQYSDGAIYECDHRLAFAAGAAVVRILSVEVFSIVGIRILLVSRQ